MVNNVVLNFIEKYANKYSEEDLKKKIVSAGYSLQEFDEAYSMYYMNFFEGKYKSGSNKEKMINTYPLVFRIIAYVSLIVGVLFSILLLVYNVLSFEFFLQLIPYLEKLYTFVVNSETILITPYQVLLIIAIPFILALSLITSSVGVIYNRKLASIGFLSVIAIIILFVFLIILIIFL